MPKHSFTVNERIEIGVNARSPFNVGTPGVRIVVYISNDFIDQITYTIKYVKHKKGKYVNVTIEGDVEIYDVDNIHVNISVSIDDVRANMGFHLERNLQGERAGMFLDSLFNLLSFFIQYIYNIVK